MELLHLRYFMAVAEELHFTRAAERLHIDGIPNDSAQFSACCMPDPTLWLLSLASITAV